LHEKYLEFVKEGFVEDVYGHALTHAKDRREVADYDIEKDIGKEEAESIIEDAENFLVRIKDAIKDILEEAKDDLSGNPST